MPRFSSTLKARATSLLAVSALCIGAIATSATPASASDDRLLKFMLGATAAAVIIHSASRAQGHARPVQARGLPQHCRETLGIHGRHVAVYNARCLHQAGFRNLAQHCRETIRTNHGLRSVYRAQCLNRGVSHRPVPAQSFPHWCRTSYHYRGHRYHGYTASCLRQAGIRHLPQHCLVSVSRQQIYSARCLKGQGYPRR